MNTPKIDIGKKNFFLFDVLGTLNEIYIKI